MQMKPVFLIVLIGIVGSTSNPAVARELDSAVQLSVGKPANVIYRSVSSSGVVSFSDQPQISRSQVTSKASTQGSAAMAQDVIRVEGNRAEQETRAKAERDYWRKQADGFASRQRERDREIENRRQAAAAQERDREQRTLIVPTWLVRGGPWQFNAQPGVGGNPSLAPVGNGAGAYTSSPGTATAAGPASFIGSGFSRAN
jgi:hypothetical protein